MGKKLKHPNDIRAMKNKESLSSYIGNIIDLTTCYGGNKMPVMYAGQQKDNRWSPAQFIISREENADGKTYFNVIASHMEWVSLSREGDFVSISNYNHDARGNRIVEKQEVERIEKLWRTRKR
jgi:hypothetical protein